MKTKILFLKMLVVILPLFTSVVVSAQDKRLDVFVGFSIDPKDGPSGAVP